MWWAIAAAALQGASSIASLNASQEQGRMMRRETDEELRRTTLANQQRLGAARAAGAASGVEFESKSLQDYLSAMDTEFRREQDWMRKAGTFRARQVEAAGVWSLVGGLGGSAMSYGASNNWWQSSKSS